MKILMLAPQPFFEPRGTPFSVLGRLRALSELGHQVDVLVYHLGENVSVPGVVVHRIPRVGFVKSVTIGPSVTKLLLDSLLFLKAIRLMRKKDYDLLHTHEEASFFGTLLARLFKVPHLYDMHSSLPQQLRNFRYSNFRPLIRSFEWLERRAISSSDAVITICPALEEHVERINGSVPHVMIENIANDGGSRPVTDREVAKFRAARPFLDGRSVVLYSGTFEPYQGLDLLVESAQRVVREREDALFLMVGGKPEQGRYYQDKVSSLGLTPFFHFTGLVPPEEVRLYIAASDVLVSPRVDGTNTPLKIYSYLRAGKPIVATDLYTHTQVLSRETSVLVEPDPDAFAEGVLSVLNDPSGAAALGSRAQQLYEERCNFETFVRKTDQALRMALGEVIDGRLLHHRVPGIRILLLTPEYPPIGGGTANACFYLVRELREIGVRVDVLTSTMTRGVEREVDEAGDLIRLPVNKKSIQYWTYSETLRFLWKARRFLSGWGREYDVNHAFFSIPSGLLAFPKRKLTPYVVSIRGSDVPGFNQRFAVMHTMLRPLTRVIWRNAAAVVSNSQGLRELAWKTMPGLDIEVIVNGVDTSEFYPLTGYSARPDSRLRLLAVNRLISRKGMDLLLRAVAAVRRELGDTFELRIVGEGNLKKELQTLATALGIRDVVTFAGAIPHENLPAVYRDADLFVLSSRTEGMSNALLEAMASGLPVIVTDTGGSAELVGDNGIVVPPDDVQALEKALKHLLSNPDLRRRMGHKSRQGVEEFSWRSVAKQYLGLYEEIERSAHRRAQVFAPRQSPPGA